MFSTKRYARYLFFLGFFVPLFGCLPNTIDSSCGPLFVSDPLTYMMAAAMDKICAIGSSGNGSENATTAKPGERFADALTRAKCGVTNSQVFVSNSFETGHGVEKNLIESHKWYALAASRGGFGLGADLRKEFLEGQMNESDIAEAKKRAAEWLPNSDC